MGIQRVPNLLRWTGLACRLPYPGDPMGANDCSFPIGISLHRFATGSATTLDVSRLQSSFIPKSTGIITARELASPPFEDVYVRACATRSPSVSVEYDYVDKQSIPTAGLSPASPFPATAINRRCTPGRSGALTFCVTVFSSSVNCWFCSLSRWFIPSSFWSRSSTVIVRRAARAGAIGPHPPLRGTVSQQEKGKTAPLAENETALMKLVASLDKPTSSS